MLLLAAGVVLSQLQLDPHYLSLHNAYMCSGAQLLSLARRCLQEPAVCSNVSPSNILLAPLCPPAASSSMLAASCSSAGAVGTAAGLDSGQLVLIDLGSDWVAPDPHNLVRYGTGCGQLQLVIEVCCTVLPPSQMGS